MNKTIGLLLLGTLNLLPGLSQADTPSIPAVPIFCHEGVACNNPSVNMGLKYEASSFTEGAMQVNPGDRNITFTSSQADIGTVDVGAYNVHIYPDQSHPGIYCGSGPNGGIQVGTIQSGGSVQYKYYITGFDNQKYSSGVKCTIQDGDGGSNPTITIDPISQP